jgi:hypothetical protein
MVKSRNYGRPHYAILSSILSLHQFSSTLNLTSSSQTLQICVFVLTSRGRVVNNPVSHSGGPGFKSGVGDRLSLLNCLLIFLRLYRQMQG